MSIKENRRKGLLTDCDSSLIIGARIIILILLPRKMIIFEDFSFRSDEMLNCQALAPNPETLKLNNPKGPRAETKIL